MNQDLKELLKPPYDHRSYQGKPMIMLKNGIYIKTDTLLPKDITHKQLNDISDWVFAAMNEKYERETGQI